jgi:hypothetical protein
MGNLWKPPIRLSSYKACCGCCGLISLFPRSLPRFWIQVSRFWKAPCMAVHVGCGMRSSDAKKPAVLDDERSASLRYEQLKPGIHRHPGIQASCPLEMLKDAKGSKEAVPIGKLLSGCARLIRAYSSYYWCASRVHRISWLCCKMVLKASPS